ncbi:hypothetical protein BD626DRAFT_553558 [Schizophyllum amplum]|uniref:Elongator complex protein 5 n=1 Tax=Schizophyllum amplum TaxID=97359 RepID=A0A550CVH6_9AGAR|nr:hypothetical protein BD626DRAFT_553558 [Auriculariopsis ampla]
MIEGCNILLERSHCGSNLRSETRPPFDLPKETCVLITDELASPASFYVYATALQRLKEAHRVLVLSAADDLARWHTIAGKTGVNLQQHINSKAFEYLDVSSELDREGATTDREGSATLRGLYDTVVDRLAQAGGAPTLVVFDALSEMLWLGLEDLDARRFCRALRALCLRTQTGLIIRFHKTADGEHDDLLAFLTQLCQFRLDVCPLSSGRSGVVSGEFLLWLFAQFLLWLYAPLRHDTDITQIALRRGASCFAHHAHIKTIPRSNALQYRLTDYSAMYFEKGTDRAVL